MSDEFIKQSQQAPPAAEAEEELSQAAVYGIGTVLLLIVGSAMVALWWRYPLPWAWRFSLRQTPGQALLEWLRLLCLSVFCIQFGRGLHTLFKQGLIPLGKCWRCLVNLLWYGGVSVYLY